MRRGRSLTVPFLNMERALARQVGTAARAARLALGWTQSDAAEQVGISFEFYSRIERGVTMPSVPTLVALAEKLGVSADVLLGVRTGKGQARGAPELREAKATWPAAEAVKGRAARSPALRRLLRRLDRSTPASIALLDRVLAAVERGQRGR